MTLLSGNSTRQRTGLTRPVPKTKLAPPVRPFPAPAGRLPACRRFIPPSNHLTMVTSMYREMDRRFWLEQAEAGRNTKEAGMELDPRIDRLPFHDPDEAEQVRADVTVPLGGHLKTGQSWTGQTRPVGERPKHECSTPVPRESASPWRPGRAESGPQGGCPDMAGGESGAPGPAPALAGLRVTPHEALRSVWSRVRQLRGPQVRT
jgi:hypothetical protein